LNVTTATWLKEFALIKNTKSPNNNPFKDRALRKEENIFLNFPTTMLVISSPNANRIERYG
jgi:hypothetical protein